MAYSDGEALILTQVQACNSFTSENTSRANWKLLNRGKAKTYAILRPGPFNHGSQGYGGAYSADWVTYVEVWERYKDDQTTLTQIEGRVEEIINRFEQYRKAQDTTNTIDDVNVARGSEPEEMWRNNADGPSWLRITLEIEWTEERSVTLQE